MPERRRCTLHHIKDILSGHKKFFYNYQIKKVNVPKFKEFCVNHIYEMVKEDETVMSYLPWFNEKKYKAADVYARQWFFDLIHTIDGTFFIKLIDEFDAKRLAGMQVKNPEQQ